MNTSSIIFIAIGFGIFESIWRRWFGGWEWKWLGPFDRRFIKHIVNIAALFSVCYFIKNLSWQWSIYTTLVMQILFWTLTFGMYFDIGRGGRPVTEEDIDAYNKPWFAKFLNWCFPDEYRYTPFYDFCGMMIRFTWPLALVFFVPTFNFGILMLGEFVALAYGLGWVMREKNVMKKVGPTCFGEIASGFLTGLMFILI